MIAPGVLYVVATPIGNLEDLTLRALRILRDVDLVACEDTRRTRKLLRSQQISTATTSYFEHNSRWKGARILAELRQGRSVALVSDAGTPAISDPGARLVSEAREEGLPVVPVPGPSAVVAALSVCGLSVDRFLFVGFLPSRPGPRRRALVDLASVTAALVFYESPVRIAESLATMEEVLGDRRAFLCREATKMHEEYLPGTLAGIRQDLLSRERVRGELVLVVDGATEERPSEAETPEALYARLVADGETTRREAVKEVARRLALPAREVYARVLEAEKLSNRSG